MPKISIIVPIYNVEQYLGTCINSILNQTFKDFELILVNDGSTDNSLEICKYYKKIDSRICIINKKNGGLSSARNAGLDIAKGEYIGFVDSDDYIHPQMYEILYNYIKKEEADISLCDFKKVKCYEKCESQKYDEKNLDIKSYCNTQASEELFKEKAITFIVAWNKLYKRKLFNDNRYKLGKRYEDEFIIHRLLYQSTKVVYVPVELYFYLKRDNSIMSKSFSLKNLDALDAYMDRINFFKSCKEIILEEKSLFMYSQEFLIHYYLVKNNIYNCKKVLRHMKRQYLNFFPKIIKLNYFTIKEKLVLMSFCINANIYEYYMKKKGRM